MANNNSTLTKTLSPEDSQWVRDLNSHRGFYLVMQAVQELRLGSLGSLLQAVEPHQLHRQQGRYNALAEVETLVSTMLRKVV